MKYYDDSNKLVNGNMKDETGRVVIEETVWLKRKIYSFLVDEISKHKKAKGVNGVVPAIILNKCKNVLLNKKCLRHLMNRIQGKDHRIGTFEIDKISLSYFDKKIYIQNNGYNGLALGYQS